MQDVTKPTVETIQLICQGKRQAFADLYTAFSVVVHNTALSYVQDLSLAEEITQDVFTNIFRHACAFKGDSAVSTWIYRITINTSLNYVKKKKRLRVFSRGEEELDSPDFVHPGVLLDRKEDARMLYKVIDSLAETQRTAFVLSFIEGLPRQEVADIMELSLKAVESLLQRAKKNLREKLQNVYPERRK